jgi:soluble lytic murein transglycosylase
LKDKSYLQMIYNRTFQLLFVTACLSCSLAAYSNNTANDVAPLQLTMLTEAQDGPRTDKTVSTSDIKNNIQQITVDSLPIDETEYKSRFSEEELAELRKIFLKAESAVRKRNKAQYSRLEKQLTDYPLYPYLQYQWLRKHLGNEDEVKTFLTRYDSSRYASILKRKWLYNLAKKRQWKKFLQTYTTSTDTSLQCYYHRAQYNTDNKQAALEAAKELWTVGRSQPKACDPLFAELKKSDLFDEDLIWRRFDAAMRNNKTSLAKYIKKLLPDAEVRTADLWLKLHRHPARHLPVLLKASNTPQTPLMFTHAISRYAGKDIYQAIDVWDKNKHLFNISSEDADRLERRLAFKLASKNDIDAYDRLGQLNKPDTSSKTKRIRVALYEQDWSRVSAAIQDLSAADQKLEKWQYWLARAYMETGHPVPAHELLTTLSEKRDFYGYLAAEILGQEYQLSDDPVEVSVQDIKAVSDDDAFRVAHEFKELGRENEAKLQWWHAVSQLDKSEIPAAAKLAQQWQWDEIAIFTIAKVKHWDDVELRFPLSYSDEIHAQAELHNIDPVILFGLIRRESAFNDDAHSHTGARGLMQIMPKTGRQIARDLKERWRGTHSLHDPKKNLRYGSYYYQKMLKKFDGHYALALAAYNAGPHRVKQWLPDESLPTDIWIETIPYSETRDYVTTVLVYAMIYQQLMDTSQLSMNDFTKQIKPSADVALISASQ